MKPKECAKYVYRKSGLDFIRLRSDGHVLSIDFPSLYRVFYYTILGKFEPLKLVFIHNGKDAMAWIDKHGNIVVRVHHDNTQTKINF